MVAPDSASEPRTSRPYRSRIRKERAADTQRLIAKAARELFTEHGFGGTTVARIAERAGVAAPTVYAIFGSKGAIVRALLLQMEHDADGAGWARRIAEETDPHRKLLAFAQWTTALLSSSKVAIRAAHGAAGDPAIINLRDEGDRHRREGLRAVITWLAQVHALPPELSEERALDRAWIVTGVEAYLNATKGCGWAVVTTSPARSSSRSLCTPTPLRRAASAMLAPAFGCESGASGCGCDFERSKPYRRAHDKDSDHRSEKGLGFETARRLLAAGHTVYLGSRHVERGLRAAARIGACAIQLDVTDDVSVRAARQTVEDEGGLDVLVNNAGIQVELTDGGVIGAADLTADMMRTTFETNVFGAVRVLHAFLPLLQQSTAPVVVNVSSGLASLTRLTTPGAPGYNYPGVAYPASKTALNVITVQYAMQFPTIRINAVEPGFTQTDLNGNNGLQTVEQGADTIVRMALVGPDGPSGTYLSAEGALPW